MRIDCPHCKQRALTRTSKRPAPVFYEVYSQCTNPDCGWSGKLHIEFALTTTPSRMANPEVRIPIDRTSRQVLLAELQSQ